MSKARVTVISGTGYRNQVLFSEILTEWLVCAQQHGGGMNTKVS